MRSVLQRRDVLLVLSGAFVVYLFSPLLQYGPTISVQQLPLPNDLFPYAQHPANDSFTKTTPELSMDLGLSQTLPETTVIAHAPGWTLFRNLYMANSTLFIVTSNPSNFPNRRMMTSTGIIALNNPENIRLREPTDQEMQFIPPEAATARWGGDITRNERHRIWSIEGISLIVNEPGQFLDHYYHFIVELLLGTWAFLYGAFNPSARLVPLPESLGMASPFPSFNPPPATYQPPPLSRLILLNANHTQWKDHPGINAFFLHAAFPSLNIEDANDWHERCLATFVDPDSPHTPEKAWHFPIALLSDRSAANRGEACGRTHRIAAEAWEYMQKKDGIDVFGQWWGHIRHRIYRFAGVEQIEPIGQPEPGLSTVEDITDPQTLLPSPKEVIITYISRQNVRRRLIPEQHDVLVASIEELVERKRLEGKNWVFKIVQPERLSKEEQIQSAAEATIMLGVHGNGLSHQVLMEPNRFSTVIEIFYPGGFAHDYEWTARSLGMRHYTVWNDTHFTYPNEPEVSYPEGFQGTSIPVHGPSVAKLIEDRLEERLHY